LLNHETDYNKLHNYTYVEMCEKNFNYSLHRQKTEGIKIKGKKKLNSISIVFEFPCISIVFYVFLVMYTLQTLPIKIKISCLLMIYDNFLRLLYYFLFVHTLLFSFMNILFYSIDFCF
jgi:hypothetical protein